MTATLERIGSARANALILYLRELGIFDHEIKPLLAHFLAHDVGDLDKLSPDDEMFIRNQIEDFLRNEQDKKSAQSLHIALSKAGIEDRYKYASKIIRRNVSSLTHLSYAEALEVKRSLK